MEMKVSQLERATVVSVIGSVDALTADEVAEFLSEQIRSGQRQLIADLSQVDFMSSAGLQAILATTKEIRRNGGDFRLAAAQPGVGKTLEMSGFTTILKTYPTITEAAFSFDHSHS